MILITNIACNWDRFWHAWIWYGRWSWNQTITSVCCFCRFEQIHADGAIYVWTCNNLLLRGATASVTFHHCFNGGIKGFNWWDQSRRKSKIWASKATFQGQGPAFIELKWYWKVTWFQRRHPTCAKKTPWSITEHHSDLLVQLSPDSACNRLWFFRPHLKHGLPAWLGF